jgi:hypothetical protein
MIKGGDPKSLMKKIGKEKVPNGPLLKNSVNTVFMSPKTSMRGFQSATPGPVGPPGSYTGHMNQSPQRSSKDSGAHSHSHQQPLQYAAERVTKPPIIVLFFIRICEYLLVTLNFFLFFCIFFTLMMIGLIKYPHLINILF